MQPRADMLINPRVRLLRPLDEGAMGTVWVGEHLTLHTEVAVKFISQDLAKDNPQVLERFQQEARAAAQIKSPNVVQMLDHGITDDGVPYIVMELLEGQSLAQHLSEHGPMDVGEAALVVTQVACALAKAHSLGIIHRDIKPENVFIVAEDVETSEMANRVVKVLDFGIAKHVELPSEITVPGMVIGTPAFMCPDQVLDNEEVGPGTDCWSLAVLAYHVLTHQLPFDGETLAQLVGTLIRNEYTPVTKLRHDLPEEADAFFTQALARDARERYDSAMALAAAFRQLADPMPTASGRWPAPGRVSLTSDNDETPGPVETPTTSQPLASDDQVSPAQPAALEATAQPSGARRNRLVALLGAVGIIVGLGLVLTVRAVVSSDDNAVDGPSTSDGLPMAGSWLDIEAGAFQMGCDSTSRSDCDATAPTPRRVSLDRYRFARLEVTVAEYGQCVSDEACSVDGLTGDPLHCNWNAGGKREHPINCVSWGQAQAYCAWAGGRLPTEAQWEYAARGNDSRRYPWGDDEALCSRAVMVDDQGEGCGRKQTWGVGSRSQGASPAGALNMAGNVREWVADWWTPRLPAKDEHNPEGPKSGSERVVRGGGWQSPAAGLRTWVRGHLKPDKRAIDLGFRCVRRTQ